MSLSNGAVAEASAKVVDPMSAWRGVTGRSMRVKPEYQGRMEWLPVGSIRADERAQRKLDESWAAKIAASFNPNLLGKPVVVALTGRNGQERFLVVDGQHRLAAVKSLFGESHQVECEVVRGVDLAGSAELFRGLNDTRGVRPFDKFLTGVTAGDAECVAISKLTASLGLRIAAGGGEPNYLHCVAALQRVYRLDGTGELLKRTLQLIIDAWGRGNENFNRAVVNAIGSVLHKYGDDVEVGALRSRLSSVAGGSHGIIGRGRSAATMLGTSPANGTAWAIVNLYNKGRSKKIAEWGKRAA